MIRVLYLTVVYGPLPAHQNQAPEGLMKCYPPSSFRYEDADFIAKARSDIPKLLDEIERLRIDKPPGSSTVTGAD